MGCLHQTGKPSNTSHTYLSYSVLRRKTMDSWLEEAYEIAQNGGYDDSEFYDDGELDEEPELEFYDA
jgi:hypothetical protein